WPFGTNTTNPNYHQPTQPHLSPWNPVSLKVHPRPRAGQLDVGLTPIDLRGHAGRMDLRDEHLATRVAELPAPPADVVTDRPLGDIDAVLIDQPLPHALGRVALLARRHKIGDQPPVDDLPDAASLDAGRELGARLAGGTDDNSACRTVLRCTP
ncbi:MAG: hypothetical protein WKF96_18290, partial [Solirubrobacteraceae bacterium]